MRDRLEWRRPRKGELNNEFVQNLEGSGGML